MAAPASSMRQTPKRPRVTRHVAITLSVMSWVLLFVVLPFRLARLGPRIGWRNGRPGPLNLLGLVPMGVGAAGLARCMFDHYPRGESVAVSLVPENLIGTGLYRYSRNPMYVSELMLWLGCSQYNGSPVAVSGGVVLGAAMRFAINREEQTLAGEFPDGWSDYASRVRRWL